MTERRMARAGWMVAAWAAALTCVNVGCGAAPEGQGGPGQVARATGPQLLLDQDGALAASDPAERGAFVDRYELQVQAGDRIAVDLTSRSFDPTVAVTLPGGGTLSNDDWQGDRERSHLDFVIAVNGTLKVEVSSYSPQTQGPYHLRVQSLPSNVAAGAGGAQGTVATAVSTPAGSGSAQGTVTPASAITVAHLGQTVRGDLSATDAQYSDGSSMDSLIIAGSDQTVNVTVSSPDRARLRALMSDPSGQPVAPNGNGIFVLPPGAVYRLAVIGERPGATGTWAVSVAASRPDAQVSVIGNAQGGAPPPSNAAPLQVGADVRGALAAGDATLSSGAFADTFTFTAAAGGSAVFDVASDAFDTVLAVVGPNGQRWENDDFGGTRNSHVEMTFPIAGAYQVVVSSYRSGERGAYEIKVSAGERQGATATAQNAGTQTEQGELAPGDRTLQSGEFVDTYEVAWTAGETVSVRLSSNEFDPYLIIRAPDGQQQDNDDLSSQDRNAGLEYRVPTTGRYQVMATSYRAGDRGHYTLSFNGGSHGGSSGSSAPGPGPSAPTNGGPGQAIRGNLNQGDTQLQSGEFADVHTLRLPQGRGVRLHLESSEFDPYLIVRTPSGHQEDNDDMAPGQRDAAIEIPAAEGGEYHVTVTSYGAGERGAYTLRIEQGPSVPGPVDATSQGAAAQGSGGRVFGIFAGISDYPGEGSDLPECANDARKMAETFRTIGLASSENVMVFTDGQATSSAIRQAIGRMSQQLTPSDVFVFFYSGHGGRGPLGSSQDPNEVDSADESIVLYDGHLLDDEMGRLFDGIRARTSILALDSCFAGGFAKDVIRRPGRVGYFSSEEDVTSAVAGQFQAGGYLAHFFQVGIQGEADADPRDALLTVGELSHYLDRQFSTHASDVRMGAAYQRLVIDRGAVGADTTLWAFRR